MHVPNLYTRPAFTQVDRLMNLMPHLSQHAAQARLLVCERELARRSVHLVQIVLGFLLGLHSHPHLFFSFAEHAQTRKNTRFLLLSLFYILRRKPGYDSLAAPEQNPQTILTRKAVQTRPNAWFVFSRFVL